MATAPDDIAALHRRALDATRRYVAGIDDDQWAQPTPCDGWTVRDLVNHLVAGNLWAAELGRGRSIADVGSALDGDMVGSNAVAAYDASADSAACAFEAPGALDAPCAVSYGPVPGSIYAGHRFIDVLIHGWDIASATGQDPDL
ncbi:MAG TPA: TIGR03086 family metal-binding protein, partial [Ilumatobacteraceae bacterium]|nr:TIGR03086 family metal-binding protein [Ilumatobacteraceae bacterium]